MLDSRTFRSIARALDTIGESAVGVQWASCEQDDRTDPAEPNVSDVFVTVAQTMDGRFTVRTARVERDRDPIYSDRDHVVHLSDSYKRTSDLDEAYADADLIR